MKAILLLVCSLGFCPIPDGFKFHYLDAVRVTSGFYRGCTGTVTDEIIPNDSYMVDLTCSDKHVGGKLMSAKVLERVE